MKVNTSYFLLFVHVDYCLALYLTMSSSLHCPLCPQSFLITWKILLSDWIENVWVYLWFSPLKGPLEASLHPQPGLLWGPSPLPDEPRGGCGHWALDPEVGGAVWQHPALWWPKHCRPLDSGHLGTKTGGKGLLFFCAISVLTFRLSSVVQRYFRDSDLNDVL